MIGTRDTMQPITQAVNLDDVQRKWDALAATWEDTGPPATPSDEDLLHYRHLLEIGTSNCSYVPSVLLLGCTPRLRELVGELHFRITCVDLSEAMYARTTKCLKSPIANEEYVRANWCEMDFRPTEYDVALGDKILDNVPPESWDRLAWSLHKAIKPKGSFISRLAPQDPSLVGVTFEHLLQRWSLPFSKGELSLKDAVSALWEQALGASVKALDSPSTQTISRFEAEIESLNLSAQRLTMHQRQLLVEFLRLFWNSRAECWSSYSIAQVTAVFHDFCLMQMERSSDYHCGRNQPIVRFLKLQ